MSDANTQDKPRKTGIMHDDDGNVDDRRVAAWVLMVAALGLGWFGIHGEVDFTTQIFSAGIWAAVALFGSTVAEKFRGPR
jgi:hypothetical protein